MHTRIVVLFAVLSIGISCRKVHENKPDSKPLKADIKGKIEAGNRILTEAAEDKDVSKAIQMYRDDAILLAEYNPMIDGKANIEKYYTEIFKRQNIIEYQKQTKEIFDFGATLLEIGKFKKSLDDGQHQEGKYFNVWKLAEDGTIYLKAESFGYFQPVENPVGLRVYSVKDEAPGLSSRNGKKIPLELDAYDALNENCVRDRDTKKLLELYTDDAVYYPFANTAKSGIQTLTAHFTDYHSNPVKIDSIQIWTYDFEEVEDGYIQYSKFYVEWTVPGFTGNIRGTGLNYYQRQENNALKFHRQIGLHIQD